MKKILSTVIALIAVLSMQAQQLPYQNVALTPEARAKDLISRLTLEEKAQLMLDVSQPIERLGVPQFQWWSEALHGIGRNGYTTVFPITMGMAASWDDQLVEKCFDAASDEARAKYMQARRSGKINRYQCLSFWTPNINIFRDPRWGRGQETYGEDPYLTSRMGCAVVRGLQGTASHSKYMKTLACAKHYAVHSGPEWNRHSFNIEDLPERDLWETYLPAFKDLVQKAGVAEVMCAYQSIDGQPCCSQTRYLQQILRKEWGFKGIVVSDCGAIRDIYFPTAHHYVNTPEEASEKAVMAGTDINCGGTYRSIPEAVKKGLLKESDLDPSLQRLLVGRFELGEFDPDDMVPWTKIPESTICSKEHNDLSYMMAQETMVLLQNKNNILPLGKTGEVAIIGPNANDSAMQWGNYSGYPKKTVTILKGLRSKGVNVKYIGGSGHISNEVKASLFNCLTTPDGEQGMAGTYWNNTNMEGTPDATAIYANAINLSNGGATVFAPGVNLEKFTGQYCATFRPDHAGKVTLAFEADDGFRCSINDSTMINRYNGEHGIRERTIELNVKPGEQYNIKIDYRQDVDLAHFKFDIYEKQSVAQKDILAQLGDADVVIFAGGISPRLEGEEMKVNAPGFKGGDRTDIQLPQCQRDLIKAIHDAGKKIVYINCSGSAVGLEPETQSCDAILQAWYPGERGGDAIADVLFGDYNPSGKLPMTIYKKVEDLPDFLDYTMKGRSQDGKSTGRTYRYFTGTPLWPFGYGLSYTQFKVESLKLKVDKGGKKAVSCMVKNTGKMDGTEVLQVYVKRTADADGPIKSLKAFKRVNLKVGESKTVTIPLDSEAFECWDAQSNTMRIIPGKYDIYVGTSSRSEDLTKLNISIK